MYFCTDKYQKTSNGKTIADAFDQYNEDFGNFAFAELKFYKAEEIKVELKEVPFVKKAPVAVKKPAVKK